VRIVVWQPAYLGDVVFASPLTAAIAHANPDAELVFVARPPGDAIARRLPGVRRVFTYDKYGRDRGLSGARRLLDELRAFKPDVWLSLHGSLRSGLFARFSRAGRTVGPAGEAGSFVFGERVPFAAQTFPGRAVALARAIGLEAKPDLRLELPDELRAQGRKAIGERQTLALIPGSEWETKRWPAAHAAALVRDQISKGWQVVLLGSPAERPLCAEIEAAAGGGCLNLCGNTVDESLGILSACGSAVGGDSGLVHAARALGVPTAMLFGPTDPARHVAGPNDAFVSLGLDCSPCSDHGSRRCPLGHHRCLRDLGPDRVAAALALQRFESKPSCGEG
jgi:heptosyltransferase-2